MRKREGGTGGADMNEILPTPKERETERERENVSFLLPFSHGFDRFERLL